MVEKLKQMFENIKKVFGGLSMSQRVTMLMGALMNFGALSALVLFATKTNYEMLVNTTQLDASDRQALEQFLKENKISSKMEGQSILVEEGRRQEILMKLSLDEKLAGTSDAFEWLKNLSPINQPSPKFGDVMLVQSRARELEGTINSLTWVKNSKVTITQGKDHAFIAAKRYPTKASVNIITRNSEIEDKDIKAVRSLVVFAVPKLIRENVGVVVDGHPFIFKQTTKNATQLDEWTQRTNLEEEYLKNKLEEFFLGNGINEGLVKRIRASVRVKLDRQVIKAHIEKLKEDPLTRRTDTRTYDAEGKDHHISEPGVMGNASVANNVAPDGKTNLKQTDQTVRSEFEFARENETHYSLIPGAVKGLSVALVFDEAEISQQGMNFREDPGDKVVVQEKLNKFRQQAANMLGIEGDDVTKKISVDAMMFARQTIKEKKSLQTVLMDVLEKSGGHFLLFGLSLFGFLYFVNVLRQAFDTPEMEEDMDEEEIKRRTTDEDVARMLDAQAESLDDIRARQVEERVRAMVKDNPDAAGSLIQRWLMEDGED